jgi:nitrile hydratase subunit beta
MTGVHDRGGWPGAGPIDKSEHEVEDWERLADAVAIVLDKKQIKTTDQLRRAIESLGPDLYEELGYYERWIAAIEILLIEKDILTREEIDAKAAELERDWAQE